MSSFDRKTSKNTSKNVHFNSNPKNGIEIQGTVVPLNLPTVGIPREKKNTMSTVSHWQAQDNVPENSQQAFPSTNHNDLNEVNSRFYKDDVYDQMQGDISKSDKQNIMKRKHMIKDPKASDKPVVTPETVKKKVQVIDMRHRLKKAFRFMHILFILSGIGLLAAGFIVDHVIHKMLSTLGINLADLTKKLMIGSGAAMIALAILGHIVAILHRFKILSWLFYLSILFLGACSTGTAGFTSLTTYNNHTVPRETLFDLMISYDGKPNQPTMKWDAVQQSYECCGIDNFTDWNESPFSRTSLRTPMTCCRNYRLEKDEFCGQNLLPFVPFENANKIIYAQGCITVMMKKLDLWHLVTGVCATIITFIVALHFSFCFFLIASHRL